MTKPGFRRSRPSAPSQADDLTLGTALFSQAQILHLMKAEFARSRRHGNVLSCAVLQVDRLPQLVDLYGAALRTSVRQNLATLVHKKTRGSDLLGLVNEDRMVLLLPETPADGAVLVVERLLRAFLDLEVSVDGKVLALTLSAGVSTSVGKDTIFFDSLLGQAEAALERATAAGGGRVFSFVQAALADDAREPAEPSQPSRKPSGDA